MTNQNPNVQIIPSHQPQQATPNANGASASINFNPVINVSVGGQPATPQNGATAPTHSHAPRRDSFLDSMKALYHSGVGIAGYTLTGVTALLAYDTIENKENGILGKLAEKTASHITIDPADVNVTNHIPEGKSNLSWDEVQALRDEERAVSDSLRAIVEGFKNNNETALQVVEEEAPAPEISQEIKPHEAAPGFVGPRM